jgi:hypothetical protein
MINKLPRYKEKAKVGKAMKCANSHRPLEFTYYREFAWSAA